METLKTKKEVNLIGLLFAFTYMVSYMTRTNFGAIIAEMEQATKYPREILSVALTGSFITYGVGQVISGVIGDRVSPKKLVTIGLVMTVMMNLLIPVCPNPYFMVVCWCVNGFAQSFMWPPIVKLMSALLSEDDYKKTTVKVNWGGQLGTIAVYLFGSLIISLLSWKWVFVGSAIAGILAIVLWNRFACDIPVGKNAVSAAQKVSGRILFSPVMLFIMVAIIMMGMLRDGVTTWMPSYISETYSLGSATAILTGVILPIFGIASFQAASALYRRKFTNPLVCGGLIFVLGAVAATLLFAVTGKNALLSVLFSALLTGCMHGVNLLLVCMLPAYFKKYGNVSTASGVINACTYVGSAISTYGIAVLSTVIGWGSTVLLWAGIALTGAVICFVCSKPWQKKFVE